MLKKNCELTLMELFFLARLMKAKYLDYDYVRAMPDVQKQYLLHEQETMEQLEEKEMIEVDFFGNVTIAEEMQELLSPVFFGEKESRLDIEGQVSHRFHITEEKIVMTVLSDGVIRLTGVTEKEIRNLLSAGKLEIHLADVRTGSKSGVFSSKDLEDKKNEETAIRMLKGEV